VNLFNVNKGTLHQFFKGKSTHRIPKIMTLAVTSCLLVTMITLDASASSHHLAKASKLSSSESTLSTSHLSKLTGFAGHWHWALRGKPVKNSEPTTTTTVAAPTTTTPTPPTTTSAAPTTTTTNAPSGSASASASNSAFPIGILDSSEPSGYAPPAAGALSGYTQTYVTDFTGSTLPSAWGTYQGQPGGDPGGQFDQGHVSVGGGLLDISTFQDSSFNNEWVTGGTCLCNIASQTYGAYFVRSRLTGAGPTGVELLWPTANVWPPEIDFNETSGGVSSTTATAHYSSSNSQISHSLNIDMTQWHTWGVIWTPSSITYTVDGNVWATVTTATAIPNIPMHLSLQSQTWCSSNWACPSSPQSMQVDWVDQYSSN